MDEKYETELNREQPRSQEGTDENPDYGSQNEGGTGNDCLTNDSTVNDNMNYTNPNAGSLDYANQTANNPVNGTPNYGNQTYGNPGYGNPGYGNPGYGNANYGNPNYGNPNYTGQPYGQQGYYGAPQGMKQKNNNIGFGIASLVLGIITILLFCTCISWITGILAIVFGILQMVKSQSKGLAIGGIITGAIGLLLTIILYAMVFINMGTYESYNDVYNEIYNDVYDDMYNGYQYNYDDDYSEDSGNKSLSWNQI